MSGDRAARGINCLPDGEIGCLSVMEMWVRRGPYRGDGKRGKDCEEMHAEGLGSSE
jgi:hypothetical protein